MSERKQMLVLADRIMVALDHGQHHYILSGAELDWVIVALRLLAMKPKEQTRTEPVQSHKVEPVTR